MTTALRTLARLAATRRGAVRPFGPDPRDRDTAREQAELRAIGDHRRSAA